MIFIIGWFVIIAVTCAFRHYRPASKRRRRAASVFVLFGLNPLCLPIESSAVPGPHNACGGGSMFVAVASAERG